jgi:heat shock protein HslJ
MNIAIPRASGKALSALFTMVANVGIVGRALPLVGMIVLAAACNGMRGGSDSDAEALEIRDWHLVELNGKSAIPADVARRPWLRFDGAQHRAEGSGGCNRTAGPYTVKGSALHFGNMISTKMACVDTAVNRQEQMLFDALQRADRYDIHRDTLTLQGGFVRLARFAH